MASIVKNTGGAGVPGPRQKLLFCGAYRKTRPGRAGVGRVLCLRPRPDSARKKGVLFCAGAPCAGGRFLPGEAGWTGRHSAGRFSAGRPAPRGLRCRRAGFFPQWRRGIRRMRRSMQGRAPRRMRAWRTLRRHGRGIAAAACTVHLAGQKRVPGRGIAQSKLPLCAAAARCGMEHGARGAVEPAVCNVWLCHRGPPFLCGAARGGLRPLL